MKIRVEIETDDVDQIRPFMDALSNLVGECSLDRVPLSVEVEGDPREEIVVKIKPRPRPWKVIEIPE